MDQVRTLTADTIIIIIIIIRNYADFCIINNMR